MTYLTPRSLSHGPRRAVGRLKTWLRSYSTNRQFLFGLTMGFPPVLFHLFALRSGLSFLASVALLAMSTAGCAASVWLMRPWFDSLSSTEQRRITALPIVGYIALGSLFVLCTMLLAFSGRWASSLLLMATWICHSLYGAGFEPSSAAYERLRGRLGRAAPMRLVANWCGILGLLLALSYVWEHQEYKGATLGIAASIAVAGVVASLRILARVRRLRTSLDEDAADVIAKLETLRQLPEAARAPQQDAAAAAWVKLRRTLGNRIDTGVSFSGVAVLPAPTLRELHHAVHRDIRTAGADRTAHRKLLARLRMLRLACAGRTDTLA
ncbi:hypothetical protein [Streptomyces sp. NPDC058280]|uniref:hypothetical protein n=1 Tax=Streptomyces sp. NPDC058280 TaxID=3346419 RepID=UPI0036EE527F